LTVQNEGKLNDNWMAFHCQCNLYEVAANISDIAQVVKLKFCPGSS